ncbi:histidine kinase, partial [Xanthomonas perforans]|nr:histidine kinase [Xanthomonas perforans]
MDIAVSPLAGLLPETSETAALLAASVHAADALLGDSPALRTALSICLHAQVPMLLVWGRDERCIYNDACIARLGPHHPAAFGQPRAALTYASNRDGDDEPAAAMALELERWSCSPVLQTGEQVGALYIGVADSTAD